MSSKKIIQKNNLKRRMKMVEVNFKDLRAAVVDLNKSGLIKKQIVLVGVAKEKIYEDFMAAMDKIEDDPETKEFPKGAEIALAYFNKMVDTEKQEKKEVIKEEKSKSVKEKKILKTKIKKDAGVNKPKKEETKKINLEKDQFGFRLKTNIHNLWSDIKAAKKVGLSKNQIKELEWNTTKNGQFGYLKLLMGKKIIKQDPKTSNYIFVSE